MDNDHAQRHERKAVLCELIPLNDVWLVAGGLYLQTGLRKTEAGASRHHSACCQSSSPCVSMLLVLADVFLYETAFTVYPCSIRQGLFPLAKSN